MLAEDVEHFKGVDLAMVSSEGVGTVVIVDILPHNAQGHLPMVVVGAAAVSIGHVTAWAW